MGTAPFAVASLAALYEAGYDIAAVVTATDKWGGRGGKTLIQSEVKQYALSKGLHILQPEKLKNPEFLAELQALKADLQVVVAFRMLPEVVWKMPPLGTLNLHGSLLPRYRGAAPIHWAVIKGETETGLTTFLLKHEIDTGDILLQTSTPIGPDESTGQVHDRLMKLGADLLVQTVAGLASGQVQPRPQDAGLASHAPKLFLDNTRINWQAPAAEVHNLIRGLSPYPTAWTQWQGEIFKIFRSARLEAGLELPPLQPGQMLVLGKKRLFVGCGDNTALELLDLQPAKRKRLSTAEFINGLGATEALQFDSN